MPSRDGGSLARAFDSPAHKARYVRWLFGTIAGRYDLATRVLSYAQDRRWKRRLVSLVAAHAEGRPAPASESGAPAAPRALDLACGTGDLTFGLAELGIQATGLDITPGMVALAVGRRDARPPAGRLQPPAAFLIADMTHLPCRDGSFDVVTTGYGLRNVPRLDPVVREVHRVLTPGGLFLSLDFNRPPNRAVRLIYLSYLAIVGAGLGLVLHGDSSTYRYIPASIRRYPGAEGVAALLVAAGFVDVRWHPVLGAWLGGLLGIHVALKPASSAPPSSPGP
jgi:demethylmenaquinone methyltransferase/2-methoxy-6-polyprenyl-1,4-benzoquinol methylase